MEEKKERFLKLDDVIRRTSLRRSTIYALMKENKFPKNLSISAKSVVWIESEIDKWIDEIINKRINEEVK
ncbi:helix-turn-helix transcriptional regulator [Mannheimia indoligenes]|uniref:helix-turn-helix transcriptional regulator n=1 Tax=Mannheimia indoligenes TaxID=3103145 RepID=UPI002FE59A83